MVTFFDQYLQQLGKSPATRQAYTQEAKKFLSFVGESGDQRAYLKWGAKDFEFYFEHLKGAGLSDNSLRRGFLSLKMFFQFLLDKDHTKGENPFVSIAIPKREETDPELITKAQWQSLVESREYLAENDDTRKAKHLRDKVLLLLIGYEGLKASEVISLKWSYFVGSSLHVPGKHPRVISLTDLSLDALAEFASHLKDTLSFAKKTYLFRGLKGPRSADKPMSRHGLKFILAEFSAELDIPKLNAECLRSHAILSKLRLGWDCEKIMEHLGLNKLGVVGKVERFATREGLI